MGDENTISAEDLLEQVHADDLPELQRALQQAQSAFGFADYISKPFSADQVLKSVSDAESTGAAVPTPIANIKNSEIAKLLLVEDHEALAELTAQQLATLGYAECGLALVLSCFIRHPPAASDFQPLGAV